ncbi:DUF4136 domain-containing protein [Algoriphagus halophytocola]|uniref:DUF4136 domain-containing protein n=1 Tax=Algoriphagus halophytocola TaxID=2991499 RepID=UPI0022DD078B|nr:DUF4136 domain-containing protein [Algoriphagus sp. TR-M9]WBL43598.1 DUF4136 domain-containing protein [Algoriphagus sp. TR-M9]
MQTIGKSDALKNYRTFYFVEKALHSDELIEFDASFKEKLEGMGFKEEAENPDFLVQSLKVSKDFVQEVGSYISDPSSSGTVTTPSVGYSDFIINSFEAGRLIFLIQDTKSNDIVWMGVGSGIFPKKEREKQLLTAQAIEAMLADFK